MKKFLLISMIAAAAVFTACSDDDESAGDVYSCDINLDLGALGSTRICVESSDKAKVTEACQQVNELMSVMGAKTDAGKTGSGCPSGAKKTCTGEKSGASYTAYFYDADAADASCDELMEDAEGFEL